MTIGAGSKQGQEMSHQPLPHESSYGYINSAHDALLLIEGGRVGGPGLLRRVSQRLTEEQRSSIRSGSIFVFDQDEANMKRWTDGLQWSPSRVQNSHFLIYKQMDKSGASGASRAERRTQEQRAASIRQIPEEPACNIDLADSAWVANGLVKKTTSIVFEGRTTHVISYYRRGDVENGLLPLPSETWLVQAVSIPAELNEQYQLRSMIGKPAQASKDKVVPQAPAPENISSNLQRHLEIALSLLQDDNSPSSLHRSNSDRTSTATSIPTSVRRRATATLPRNRRPDSAYSKEQGSGYHHSQVEELSASAEVNATVRHSPYERTDANNSPVMKQAQYGSPVIKQAQYGSPVIKQTQYGSPVIKQAQYGSPVIKQTQYGSPVVRQQQFGSLNRESHRPAAPQLQIVTSTWPRRASQGAIHNPDENKATTPTYQEQSNVLASFDATTSLAGGLQIKVTGPSNGQQPMASQSNSHWTLERSYAANSEFMSPLLSPALSEISPLMTSPDQPPSPIPPIPCGWYGRSPGPQVDSVDEELMRLVMSSPLVQVDTPDSRLLQQPAVSTLAYSPHQPMLNVPYPSSFHPGQGHSLSDYAKQYHHMPSSVMDVNQLTTTDQLMADMGLDFGKVSADELMSTMGF